MTLDLVRPQTPPQGEPPILSEEEARDFVGEFERSMVALIATIDEETALVRAGRLFDATDVLSRKSAELARYLQTRTRLKREFATIIRLAPDLLAGMRDQHLAAIEKIRANLGVLAVAREVAEGIVRNVSASVGRHSAPATYGRNAAPSQTRAVAARGIALDRRM